MWKYKNKNIKSVEDFPAGVIGFVYEIEADNGKKYIGKKSVISTVSKLIGKKTYDKLKADKVEGVFKTRDKKLSKPGNPVWKYKQKVRKETDWLNYTGSSIALNEDISNGTKITKKILQMCYTKKQMTYWEMKFQFCSGVLEDDNYYNENIGSNFWPDDLKIQPDLFFHTEE